MSSREPGQAEEDEDEPEDEVEEDEAEPEEVRGTHRLSHRSPSRNGARAHPGTRAPAAGATAATRTGGRHGESV